MAGSFQCRSCGARHGEVLLDLGEMPLANGLLVAADLDKPERRYPLRLAICGDCQLLQITELVSPEALFLDYVYFSSISDAWKRHCAEAARRYLAEFRLGAQSRVVEIASNDGCLLRHFLAAGVPCLGIEPARNIAAAAIAQGIETWQDFFGEALARRVRAERGAADLILANNVYAHAPAIDDFTAGLAMLLADTGVAVLEFPHAMEMIQKLEFDTIYHEHVFYFTLNALRPVLARHGLAAWRVERLPTHGGSLRLFLGRAGAHPVEESVAAVLADEAAWGVDTMAVYRQFAQRVMALRSAIRAEVSAWRQRGEVAAYGAAAKGCVLLNYCGLDRSQLAFVVDRSPHKQGRWVPGVRLPILPVSELAARRPVAALLLAWNFAEEILAQQAAYRTAGGKFIIPIPAVQVV